MDAPFTRGLAWYRYKGLEEEFIQATKYFPFEKEHKEIWSEFFGDLLIKTGNSIDSFFRNMLKDKDASSSCQYPHVQALQACKRKKDINYFRDFFEPIYVLSGAEVDIAYGLTFYDAKFRPFEPFAKNDIPSWWTAYNHVKHTWFDCLGEATLENVVGALAGLFILNVLNTSSRLYLLNYQNVIKWDYMESTFEADKIKLMKASKIGFPKEWKGYNFTASTPIFIHSYRIDQEASYNTKLLGE
jgi:hypothetical protein